MPRSGQEFDAVGLAAAPDHFAGLVLWTIGDQRQTEPVPDIDRDIAHDSCAARRHVEHHAFVLRYTVINGHPAGMLVQRPPRFARYLDPWYDPWLFNAHGHHPVRIKQVTILVVSRKGPVRALDWNLGAG